MTLHIFLCISPSNPMYTWRVVYLASNDDLFILEVFIEVLDTYTQGTGR